MAIQKVKDLYRKAAENKALFKNHGPLAIPGEWYCKELIEVVMGEKYQSFELACDQFQERLEHTKSKFNLNYNEKRPCILNGVMGWLLLFVNRKGFVTVSNDWGEFYPTFGGALERRKELMEESWNDPDRINPDGYYLPYLVIIVLPFEILF